MATKKSKAQIEIDVNFVGNTQKLYKQIEDVTKKLNLDSGITKNLSTSLEKSFKSGYDNMQKMISGLSQKGLKPNQYTELFNKINGKLQDSNFEILQIKKNLDSIFNSKGNQANLKALTDYQKQLKLLQKQVTSFKKQQTYKQNSKTKIKDSFNLDYENKEVRAMLNKIKDTKEAKKNLTPNMSKWMENVGLDVKELERVIELMKQIEKHEEKIKTINQIGKKMTGASNIEDSINAIKEKIARLQNETYLPKIYSQNNKLLKDNVDLFDDLSTEANNFEDEFHSALSTGISDAEEFAKANNTIKEILGQFGIVLSAGMVVRAFKDMTSAAFNFYRSLDSALNEIYVVSDLSIESVNDLTGSFINMAENTGMSIDDVTRAAVLFYQQGLNTDEVMEMTEVTSQFAKVAGIDATDAADKLTAAVNGYCLSAENASIVADKFNKVAAASAADINELSTAFSKAAAQANQAGVGMDNYLAYIATMVEATREAPENIGTSLKTIFSRMQQIKEAGSSEDGVTTINNVEKALRSVGIPLRDANNQLRNLEDVFADLGPKWQSLDRNTQAYLGTIIAGTRQQSRFITLMQNWDRVLDLSAQSENSAGQQALMHAKAMESIESKMQQMNVALQEFVSNLADSDLFKGIISGLTTMIRWFNNGSKPILLVSTAIQIFTKRLDTLSKTISKKMGGFFKEKPTNPLNNLSKKQVKEELESNANLQIQEETKINELKQKQYVLIVDIKEALAQQVKSEGNVDKEQKKQIKNKQHELELINKQIDTESKNMNILKDREKSLKGSAHSKETEGRELQNLGIGISSASILISQFDDNIGSLTGSIGTATTAVGQFLTGDWVGGIINASMGIYQIYQTIENWDENKMKRINDAIDNISSSLENVININTEKKATVNLINTYEELNRKIYKTTEEQEQLNNVIQQMSDSYNIDTVTDQYGNLSININSVKEELKELNKERDEALEQLTKDEKEGRESLDRWYDKASESEIQTYYEKLITKNKTKYRALMDGIIDNMSADERGISNSLYEQIQAAFKETTLNEVTGDNLFMYDQDGLANSIKKIEDDMNAALSADDWSYFYEGISNLQGKIDTLSWEDFQISMDEMFSDWWKSIGLTEQQWMQLKKVIENTLYGSNSFTEFMDKYGTTVGPNKSQANVNKIKNDLLNDYKEDTLKKTVYVDASKVKHGRDGVTYNGHKLSKNRGGYYYERKVSGNNASEDFFKDEGIKSSYAVERSSEKTKELNETLKDYKTATDQASESTKNFSSEQARLANTIQQMKGETVENISQYSEMFAPVKKLDSEGNYKTDKNGNYVYAKKKVQEAYTKEINDALSDMPSDYSDNEMAIYLTQQLENSIENIDDEEVKKQLENTLKQIEGSLDMAQSFTWSGIIESLKNFSSALQTTNDCLGELKENGYITGDAFAELANTMDNLSFEDIFASFDNAEEGLAYLNGLNDALDNLDVAYDANTDSINMNVESLEYLQDAQERAAKGKIKNMINELAASKASAESQVAYIKAQMAAVEAMIAYLDDGTDKKIKSSDLQAQADSAYVSTFNSSMKEVNKGYSQITGDSLEWAKTTISHISEVADAWSKYWAAVENHDINAKELKKKAEELSTGKYSYWDDLLDKDVQKGLNKLEGLKKNSQEAKDAVADLQEYYNKLDAAQIEMTHTVDMYENQIKFLQGLYNQDLSNFGRGKKAREKAVKEYISQLEEMLDLITHIERETNKLNIYKNLYDIQTGKRAVDNLNTQIKLVEHLLGDYEKAYDITKTRLNMQAQEIISQFGDAIEIAEDGSYKIVDAIYNGFSDDNKKAFDKALKSYDDLIKKTDEYYDNFVGKLKDEKSLRQEYIDTYIKGEDTLVEAIKSREKKILDNKLAAIDKEIDAINRAADARRKAREDEDEAKQLSELQVDLQRALMDSSGASAVDILQIQKQIKDKQQSIADKSFDTMVSDINEQLQNEKDLEQKLFDERLEEMDWYWNEVDRIMGEGMDSITEVMTTYMDNFNQASDLQQEELLRGWEDTFGRALAIGKNGTAEMQQVIEELQQIINSVDIDEDLAYLKGTARPGYATTDVLVNKQYKYNSMKHYANGGMNYSSGVAWLDGSATQPEAVLNSLETKAFLQFTDSLVKLRSEGKSNLSNNVVIDNINFNVDSMSSVEDGEKAFDAFVNKFKEIGGKQGISLLGTSNRN